LFNGYRPSESEQYTVEHAEELGLTATKTTADRPIRPTTCRLWTNASLPVHLPLQWFRKELDDHEAFLRDTFRPLKHDIRWYMTVDASIATAVRNGVTIPTSFSHADSAHSAATWSRTYSAASPTVRAMHCSGDSSSWLLDSQIQWIADAMKRNTSLGLPKSCLVS
jgi:hypothetical protein